MSEKKAQLLVRSLPRKAAKLRSIEKYFKSQKDFTSALDIGTSHGSLIEKFTSTGDWTFLDPDTESLSHAKKNLKGNFVNKSAEDFFNINQTQFNLVTCFDVLMYFSNPQNLFQNVFQALKPNGVFLLVGTHFRGTLRGRINKIFGTENKNGFLIEPSPEEVKDFLQKKGMTLISEYRFSGPCTQLCQSFIDASVTLFVNAPNTSGDSLTLKNVDTFRESEKRETFNVKIILLNIMRVLSFFCILMDEALLKIFRRPDWFDGYLLVTQKSVVVVKEPNK